MAGGWDGGMDGLCRGQQTFSVKGQIVNISILQTVFVFPLTFGGRHLLIKIYNTPSGYCIARFYTFPVH